MNDVIIFLISGFSATITTAIILTWNISQIKEQIIKDIGDELNELENSIIKINAKLELSNQKCDHDFVTINERVSNLKNNCRSKIQDLKFNQNELINFMQILQKETGSNRQFIIRNRSKETITDFDDDEWTAIKRND